MKKISLQWRLTCIITLYIAVICGCLTLLVYKNGIYYIDSLQETVDARGDDAGDQGGDGTADGSDQIYISIPEDKWDEFARDFSVQVYNNKADYKRNSLILSALLALLGGVATYFISGHALRPIREFSEKIEEVQAQNLADSRIEENKVKDVENNNLEKIYNQTVKKVTEDYESLNFNTAISAMMIFVNAVYKEDVLPKYMAEGFVKLLNPICPHVTEEMWQYLGHNNTITYESWPTYDVDKTKEEEYELVVQVNGKLRGKIVTDINTSEEDMKSLALNLENVKKYICDKEIVKVIVIPKKLVNIVVKM